MEGNSISLVSSYVSKAKGGKAPAFALPNETKRASQLYGMDFTPKQKSVIKEIKK